MSNVLYIQIMYPCSFYGKDYKAEHQFIYVSEEMRSIDHKPGGGTMMYYHGLDCDGNDVLVPGEYSVITPICVSKDIQARLRDLMMDKTTDYYDKVLERLGIDMKLNHSIQFNPEPYKRLYLKTPADESTGKTVLFDNERGYEEDSQS